MRFQTGKATLTESDGLVVKADFFHPIARFLRSADERIGKRFGIAALAGACRYD